MSWISEERRAAENQEMNSYVIESMMENFLDLIV